MNKYHFQCDYAQGFDAKVLDALVKTNMEQTVGYGLDPYCQKASELVRSLCKDNVQVFFGVGGTQTNSIVIQHFLRQYQGVIAADTGHINTHETGAIEHSGHKVITIQGENGKLSARSIQNYIEIIENDDGKEHLVLPKMVYISQPTELGTMYSETELNALRKICDQYHLYLFMDGARLGYALAYDGSLDYAKYAHYCDCFTIGLTKCGAGFGEIIVFKANIDTQGFRNVIKQNGALLAKGRLLGVSALALLEDNHYIHICQKAIVNARRLVQAFKDKGVQFYIDSPTNQLFPILTHSQQGILSTAIKSTYWCRIDDNKDVLRLVTSWGNTDEEIDCLLHLIEQF